GERDVNRCGLLPLLLLGLALLLLLLGLALVLGGGALLALALRLLLLTALRGRVRHGGGAVERQGPAPVDRARVCGAGVEQVQAPGSVRVRAREGRELRPIGASGRWSREGDGAARVGGRGVRA